MIKKIVTLFFVLISFLCFTKSVEAHVLKYDGSIGAVLHVDPDDDPIAGQLTNFFFEFRDKTNKFTPQECNCKIVVIENGKQIYFSDLFSANSNPSLTNASFSYIFPTKDVYKVIINGTPKDGESFQKFSLIYDIRVARIIDQIDSSSQSQSTGNWFLSNTFLIIVLVLILFSIMIFLKMNRNRGNKL